MREFGAWFLLINALSGLGLGCSDPAQTPPPSNAPDLGVIPDMTSEDQAPMRDMGEDMRVLIPSEFGLEQRPSNTTCVAGPRPKLDAQVKLTRVWEGVSLRQPVEMIQPPGQLNRWYVVEQAGRVVSFEADAPQGARKVLDISARISTGGERGLLGLAFHPQWQQNRRAFISYTYIHPDRGLTSRIAQVHVKEDGSLDDGDEVMIIEADQPYNNHNGGQIAFGPDGYLYIGWGDGGSGGDPENNGQDAQTLLGAMLRLDVDGQAPYEIPADNPFANKPGGLPELYAWGLRNPWKFSFDQETGTLWAGDVGQSAQEEVDIIELGGNYGWNVREGTSCYRNNPLCQTRKDYKEPVVVYGRGDGKSITGGYVYHGQALPGLIGRYLYGDFVTGKLWAVVPDEETGEPEGKVLMDSTGLSISAFAQDKGSGEVYILDYDPEGVRGAGIYRVDPEDAQPGPVVMRPSKLSQTGCVDPQDPRKPASGLIPYEPVAPFWSDGARKDRHIALPEDMTIMNTAAGGWELPVGSVIIKNFRIGGELVETRHFMRHDDGVWAGYSYEWDDDGKDATLLAAGKRKRIGDQVWIYPDRGDCLGCHNAAAGHVLGFAPEQLVADAVYPGDRVAPQLKTLAHIGVIEEPAQQMGLVSPSDQAQEIASRAKAYLESNCAYCHRPDGVGRGEMDLRWQSPLEQMGLCEVNPELGSLGIEGAKLLAPGAPERSILVERMSRRDVHGMPAVGSTLVDEVGVLLVSDWIKQLERCP